MSERQPPRPPTTTDAGVPVASQEHSLTIGPDGPVLLQDFYLIEQMANFNRERIPERQPHAKGGGAFGTFVVTHDVSRYTKAAVFQPGTETDVVLRFSTSPASGAHRTPGATPEASPSSSTLARATSTSSATTRPSSSFVTPSSSRTSFARRGDSPRTTCGIPTCSGTSGRFRPNRRIRSPG